MLRRCSDFLPGREAKKKLALRLGAKKATMTFETGTNFFLHAKTDEEHTEYELMAFSRYHNYETHGSICDSVGHLSGSKCLIQINIFGASINPN